MAADGGRERNVVHRMNEGYRAWMLSMCAGHEKIVDDCEVSI